MDNKMQIFEKKNVLVTGGAGFIGSHLCERLLKDANVICMDDLSHSDISNVQHLLQYPDFEFIKYDVNEKIDLNDFPELDKFKVRFQGIQEIYHMACPTSQKNFENLKIHSLWSNSKAMLNTLDLAVEYRAKYVFGSSSVVYGSVTETQKIFSEEYQGIVDHLSPRSCYNEGKRFAETCISTYKQVYGLDAKIARIFTTYGPRMRLRDGLLVPDFILNALEGKNLVIYGDGSGEEALCYVSDLVDGLVRLMSTGPDVNIVNLGLDESHNIKEIAEKIIAMTNSTSQIIYEEPLMYLSKKGLPDLRRAKEKLEWIPLVRIEEGLRRTIEYTLANKESYNFRA